MNNRVGIRELAMALVNKNKLSMKDAELFVATMFDTLNVGLNQDKQVKLKGLGTFKVMSVSARKSVDVNTGEPIVIDGRDKISFTPDSTMKDLVNKPFAQFDTVAINEGVDIKELERTDWTEMPTDLELTISETAPENEGYEKEAQLPPSKIEAAMNEAAEALTPDLTQNADASQATAELAPAKHNALTQEQLAALNGDSENQDTITEGASNTTNQLTLSVEQLRLLNDDNETQTVENCASSDEDEQEQLLYDEPQPQLTSQNNDRDVDNPNCFNYMDNTCVDNVEHTLQETGDKNQDTEDVPHGEPIAKPEGADDVLQDDDIADNTENDIASDEPSEKTDEIETDEVELDEEKADNVVETTDEQPLAETDNKDAAHLSDGEQPQTSNNDSEESGEQDEEAPAYDDEDWEEEERRSKRKRLIIIGVVAVIAIAAGITWYLMNQMQLKDNRISHLETMLKKTAPTPSKNPPQTLSPADSAREDSINKAIDAQTQADLAASEAKLAQAAEKKDPKADAKPNEQKNASAKISTERPAANTKEPAKDKENADKALDFKQYNKDARVRTGAYKIVGIAHVVTVRKGQTLYSLSKSMLGPGMECYIEAVNGNLKELKEGQKVKIPKLELKKLK